MYKICGCGYVCDLFILVGRNIINRIGLKMSDEFFFNLTVVEFFGVCINRWLTMCIRPYIGCT